jgi:hypothetical protein
MSTVDRGRYYSPSYILRLIALLCFIAAFCVAQAWLTKGTFPEWLSAGLAVYVLAELA